MESERKVETIERTYWSCLVETHRHRKEIIAQKCIAKSNRPKRPHWNSWTREAKKALAQRVDNGESRAALAAEFKVSKTRIKHVADMGRRMLQYDLSHATPAQTLS